MYSQGSQVSLFEPSYKRARVASTPAPVKRRYLRKRYPKVAPSVRKYVKTALTRNLELKNADNFVGITPISPWLPAATPAGSGICFPLLPNIGQGTGSAARIGNEVNLKSNKLMLSIGYRATNIYPTSVILWIVSTVRTAAQANAPDVNDFANFFKYGSTSATFQGNMLDWELEVNPEFFKLHRKEIFDIAPIDVTLVGKNITTSNSRSVWNVEIDLIKYVSGKLRFDDNDSTYATNKNLYFILQPVFDNMSDSAAATQMANMSYATHAKFIDA